MDLKTPNPNYQNIYKEFPSIIIGLDTNFFEAVYSKNCINIVLRETWRLERIKTSETTDILSRYRS